MERLICVGLENPTIQCVISDRKTEKMMVIRLYLLQYHDPLTLSRRKQRKTLRTRKKTNKQQREALGTLNGTDSLLTISCS